MPTSALKQQKTLRMEVKSGKKETNSTTYLGLNTSHRAIFRAAIFSLDFRNAFINVTDFIAFSVNHMCLVVLLIPAVISVSKTVQSATP